MVILNNNINNIGKVMNNIINEDLTKILNLSEKIGKDIPQGIKQLTKTFIDLVEQEELIYFAFDSTVNRNRITIKSTNKTSGYEVSRPSIVMYIRVKGNGVFQLGTIGDAKEKEDLERSRFGGDQITEFTRKAIADVHDYLCFINTYASQYIPVIEKPTRYARDSFDSNKCQSSFALVPSFCEYLITDELKNKHNRLKMK